MKNRRYKVTNINYDISGDLEMDEFLGKEGVFRNTFSIGSETYYLLEFDDNQKMGFVLEEIELVSEDAHIQKIHVHTENNTNYLSLFDNNLKFQRTEHFGVNCTYNFIANMIDSYPEVDHIRVDFPIETFNMYEFTQKLFKHGYRDKKLKVEYCERGNRDSLKVLYDSEVHTKFTPKETWHE